MGALSNLKERISFMKHVIVLILLAVFTVPALADNDITTPQPLGIWHGYREFAFNIRVGGVAKYEYYKYDADGQVIRIGGEDGKGKYVLQCVNVDSVPDVSNSDCIATSNPHPCCANPHPNAGNTCDDTFDPANCVGKDNPVKHCTGLGTGYTNCRSLINPTLQTLNNLMKTQVDIREGVTRQ